jgi:dienelactone hydrolase
MDHSWRRWASQRCWVQTYDSRQDLATGFIERVLNITETMFVADGYAALAYLASRPEIDPHKVALAGFSYGGMATEYALYSQMADALALAGLRFVATWRSMRRASPASSTVAPPAHRC